MEKRRRRVPLGWQDAAVVIANHPEMARGEFQRNVKGTCPCWVCLHPGTPTLRALRLVRACAVGELTKVFGNTDQDTRSAELFDANQELQRAQDRPEEG